MWMRCGFFKRAVFLLALFVPSVMAANYSVTVTYESGGLYYAIYNRVDDSWYTDSGKDCFDASKTFHFELNSKELNRYELNFYTDDECHSRLSSGAIPMTELFTNSQQAKIIVNDDGSWEFTNGKKPDGPGMESSSSVRSSSSSRWPPVLSSSSRAVSSSSRGGAVRPGGDPVNPPLVQGKKVIRFMPHWTNTSAILIQGLEETIMTAVPKYCGWYQTTVQAPDVNFYVQFKQTIGTTYVGANGSSNKKIDSEEEISLDSIAALGDTIWIRGYKSGAPDLTINAPGVLGDCAPKRFPVTVFDWYGAGKDGVNADFEASNGCTGKNAYDDEHHGFVKGMVEYKLGDNGVPVRAKDFPEDYCRASEHLDSWFLPEDLGKGKNGEALTNKTCRDIYLTMQDDGFWLAEISKDDVSDGNDKTKKGMFIVDDFEYLQDGVTPNPYYDQLSGNGGRHNFSYAVKIQAKFEYVPGQYFDFYGDDDVWVFIDRRLAVDIGGQHTQAAGAVLLDTIGQNTGDTLVPGQTYDFHIFYAERHTSESNFRMHTSIDLQVDASMFLVDDRRGAKTDYYIWQVNRKSTFTCDMDDNAKDTTITGGRSTFKLSGGSFTEPEELTPSDSCWYSGICITSDSTFTIDSASIVDNYALAPGHYFLEITLKDDPMQKSTVEITIPSYAIPSIAYADSNWKILGTEVSGDTLQIGKWAYEVYPVHISFLESWAQVNNYNKKVNLMISSSLVDILDENGNKISKVTLDDDGHATFYVRANGEVKNAVLTAQGAAATASIWKNLQFDLPPIPRVSVAKLYDRNGDGRGDSLYIKFDRELDSRHILDSLQFKFGESFPTYGAENFKVNGNVVVLVSDNSCEAGSACGFGSRRFTGGETEVYSGSMMTWFTYIDENRKDYHFQITDDPVEDGIGPVIVSAERKKNSDGARELTLTFSEGIKDGTREHYASMFEFICKRNGEERTPEKPVLQSGSGNMMVLVYSASTTVDAVIPMDGDQIRFVPGPDANSTMDLLGIAPHKNNPWVPITGEQELSNESPGVVLLNSENPIVANPTITQPKLIKDPTKTAQEIGDENGVQGNLIDFDIYKVIQEQTKKEIAALDAYIETMLGEVKDDTVYNVTEMTEEEALQQLFDDIRSGVVSEAYGVSEELIAAVVAGEVTVSNYKSSSVVTSDDLKAIETLKQKNIEESRDTTMTIIPASNASMTDLFAAIVSGRITEDELLEAGISETVIKAIKDGTITAENLPSYRSAELTLMNEDDVVLSYSTKYYTHLGHYVGGTSGKIVCSDTTIYGQGGCKVNKGKIFLAWNMRNDNGRLVGTGVYIARLQIKLYVADEKKMDQTRDKLWGVRRGNPKKAKPTGLNWDL